VTFLAEQAAQGLCIVSSTYCNITAAECCNYVVTASCCNASYLPLFLTESRLYDYHSPADFSSKGPTSDGRLKPDVVAPGRYITSANSDGLPNSGTLQSISNVVNNLQALQGTSFSTPLVAGAAALLRQWLTSGYGVRMTNCFVFLLLSASVRSNYPTGQPVAVNAIATPPGSLLKALLIASARPLTGIAVVQGFGAIPLPDAYSSYSNASVLDGFGRVALENVIYSDVRQFF
jgi:hypothetical protein